MENLEYTVVPVTPFQQNCTIIWNRGSKSGVLIDPGGEVEVILEAISSREVKIEKILLTHGHIDHIGGAADLAKSLRVSVEGPHRNDSELMKGIEKQAEMFGLSGFKTVEPDRWLSEGDSVSIAGIQFDVSHCPGHSPGHVVFSNSEINFAIVGDVLFNGSIGRTDLPGGNHQELLDSIRNKLLPLGDQVSFICGHGPSSTIGHERKTNPFLQTL